MRIVLSILLVSACHLILPMDFEAPLLFNYTFAACQPEDIIENLKEHMQSTNNFDTTGKLFEKLMHERFSVQDLDYLIEIISSGKKISYNTACYSSAYKQENFLYSSVAMVLQKEGLLDQKNEKLRKLVDQDLQKYVSREKNMPLYLNPFCRDRELVSRFYYKLIENRIHMKKRNTLYLNRNEEQRAILNDFFDSDHEGESLTSKLLKDLELKLIERGVLKKDTIYKMPDVVEPKTIEALCSSPIPKSFDKIVIDDSMSLDDVDAIMSNLPEFRYSSDIKKLNDKLIEMDEINRVEKNILVQRFIKKLESNKSFAHVHDEKSVRFDETVIDTQPPHRARRSRRHKK